MPQTITTFDTTLHHIHTEILVTHPTEDTIHNFEAILDTGAPWTEFCDDVLPILAFPNAPGTGASIKAGLQTQKYAKVVLPKIETCGQVIEDLPVFISKFDETWGIDALIGLDFFRLFDVTISYRRGVIIATPV